MCKTIIPKITLVGAGPGDPELITLKGLRAIQSADVILYDALIAKALLDDAPKDALKIYVGKRANQHKHSQENINLLMVQYALLHGHVVRLKGGDPFVFGRGHEEMVFAQSFDVPVEVIPGISSAIALPELQGIPVTRRGMNESFWVLTGTTKSGQLSKDLILAAQSTATIIILMGMHKLAEITHLFIKQGKQATSVMLIQNGSCQSEKVVLGCVENIVYQAQMAKIGTPGIIVIGDVVSLHHQFEQNKVLQAVEVI